MQNNKSYLTPLLVSVGVNIILIITVYQFFRETPVNALKSIETVVEKNKEEITEQPSAIVKTTRKEVIINAVQSTPYYGRVSTKTVLNRDSLQFKHSIGAGAVVLNTAFLGRGFYAYKNFYFDIYGGYDFEKYKPVYGVGVGGVWSF